ncbi:uncharacterized protein LY89DRAFT_682332 [Mollisia scopiformis]|uniref:Peroxin 20 n=1 Tax=Mollisia scopiformis TaxID=149040 RepID=A0A194XK89_MOLSC|nr:uncharacterized protein LY89DRAFT_682332 [Mollisia scopiformis]KUJ20625.1 hypothetical protein LY89DRAFT_682332 [Mollisia scopiformis]
MADGLCGPSNALQNIQKHSTVDRTLQQDRIISRQTPSQGFRSTGQNAGFMDHEFEAFQAGQLPLEHGFQPNTFQHAPPSLQQAGPPSWAADFQRMNISSPAPQVQQQPFGMQAQQRQDTGGWHQDFARQQMAERSVQSPSHTASPFQSRMLGMGSQFTGTYAQPSQLSVAQQKQPEDAFDEAAFERAFDAAARAEAEAEALHDCAQHENAEMGQEVMLNESAEVLMASDDLEERADELLSQERIGADTIHDPLFDDRDQPANEDPEELARTAAKLLVSVQHEQSTKFQNSQFLSLMRQFRDREKTVEGDNVVTKNGMGGTDQDMNDERSQVQGP